MLCCDPTDRHDLWRERPSVVFEVISPSSQLADRNYKRARYAGLPSVTDYVLVAQDNIAARHHARSRNFEPVDLGAQDALFLAGLDLSIPIAEFYDQIDFQEHSDESA